MGERSLHFAISEEMSQLRVVAVNATHPDYDPTKPHDVLGGEDAIKAAGERYLPRLDSFARV
jgi:hypothetical protein